MKRLYQDVKASHTHNAEWASVWDVGSCRVRIEVKGAYGRANAEAFCWSPTDFQWNFCCRSSKESKPGLTPQAGTEAEQEALERVVMILDGD